MKQRLRLPRALPAQMNTDPRGVQEFVNALCRKETHSVMVVRHGHVIAEGWWAPHQREDQTALFSLSKSFVSMAVGLALEEGLLELEERVLPQFPESPMKGDPRWEALTIRHLLTMTMGHDTGNSHRGIEFQMDREHPWLPAILSEPLELDPGSYFTYDNRSTFLLSALLQQKTGCTVFDYLKPRLLDPLGMEDAWWEQSPEGISAGAFGLNLRTEDLACFGQLLLQRGWWQGRRLIDPAWVDQATQKQVDNFDNDDWWDWRQGYGYQFWRCSRADSYRADGAWGQSVLVLPHHDAVVISTAGCKGMNRNLEAVWEYLLPAMEQRPDPSGQRALHWKLAGLDTLAPSGGHIGQSWLEGRWKVPENPLGIEWAELHPGHMALCRRGHSLSFAVGDGNWKRTDTGYAGEAFSCVNSQLWPKVGARGGWEDDRWNVTLVWLCMPYQDQVSFTRTGQGTVRMEWCRVPDESTPPLCFEVELTRETDSGKSK